MDKFLFGGLLFLLLLPASFCRAQQITNFDLDKLLKNGGLVTNPGQNVQALADGDKKGILCQGIAWLKGIAFSTGTIDFDLRGKDVYQQSFLGIAFHGVDTVTYESIYFRPFNFRADDTLRKKHAVQYISQPDYPWDRLRKESPLVYENGIENAPAATAWFHAHIVVNADSITVYVNHSATYSLKVKKLSNRNDGLIGLWSSSLSGDFANLVIKPTR